MLHTPHGRPSFTAPARVCELTRAGASLRLGTSRTTIEPGRRVPGRLLRRLEAVQMPRDLRPSDVPIAQALASAGVIVVDPSGTLPFPCVTTAPQTSFASESASVAARRQAWAPAVEGVPVSALLCSNRPDRLPVALEQLAAMTHRPLQVVVVTHGFHADLVPEGTRTLLRDSGVDLVVVEAPATAVFGEALSIGARHADGDVVTKVDDDDIYGPDHVTDLLVARKHSGAVLVGKALQYVYVEEIDTTIRQDGQSSVSTPETFSTWVCGGTLALDRVTGHTLGWFDAVPSAVDRNIQDKVLAAGGRIYRTHGLGYAYVRHTQGHTYGTSWAKYLRGALEQRPGMWPGPDFHPTNEPEAHA